MYFTVMSKLCMTIFRRFNTLMNTLYMANPRRFNTLMNTLTWQTLDVLIR